MSDRISWIEHKGKQILYVDYSGLFDDEVIKATQEVNDFITKIEKYELFILVDVRNSIANEKWTVDALKNNASTVGPYTKKAAVVGVTKTQDIILTVVNMFSGLGIKPFDTVELAKNWLVE